MSPTEGVLAGFESYCSGRYLRRVRFSGGTQGALHSSSRGGQTLLIRFWGTRGSIPAPGPATMRYGGNTSCVEVRSGETLFVLDCGTGARALGTELAAASGPIHAHILLTHIHWDHIQGFPFFPPIFLPNAELDVYGPGGLEQSLEEALNGQMQYTYFPVELRDLAARFTFHELGETIFPVGSVTVSTEFLNHPCPTLGYRLEAGGKSIAYITDHEPFLPHDPSLPLGSAQGHPAAQRQLEFVSGVDLLIHDAQYTSEEYPAKRGWGHSTIDYVVDLAVVAGVRRLALFHHDPGRTDEALTALAAHARERARSFGSDVEIFAAAEGQTIELLETAPHASVSLGELTHLVPQTPTLLIVGDPEERRGVRWALVEDGYFFAEAGPNDSASTVAGAPPDGVVLVPPPGMDPVSMLAHVTASVPGVPVVVLLEDEAERSLIAELAEQAADVLIAPYTLPSLRARIRSNLGQNRTLGMSPVGTRAQTERDSLQAVDRFSQEGLDAFLEAGMRCRFAPGDVLFTEGDPPGGVYYIHNGQLRITLVGRDGRQLTAGYAGAGDTIGEMSALDGSLRSATVTAVESIFATYVSADAFRKALEQSPTTAVRLLRLLIRRLHEVDKLIVIGPRGEQSRSQEVSGLARLGATGGAEVLTL